MGALTSSRKRGDAYYFTPNFRFPFLGSADWDNPSDTHNWKKRKFSSSYMQSTAEILRSSASKVRRYPEPLNPIPREVHAPCRVSKLGFCSSLNREPRRGSSGAWKEEDSADLKGKLLSYECDRRKRDAIATFRYLKNDEEVIDVDAETDNGNVYEDLSNEDVVVLENERELRSVVSGQRSQEENGKVVAAENNFQPSSSSCLDSDLTLESLSLNRELDGPVHKKLLEPAERWNYTLKSWSDVIRKLEKFLATLRSPVKKPQVKDVPQYVPDEAFVCLTKEEEAEVSRAFSNSSRRELLAAHEDSNIEITGEVLRCLRPGAWLNDEVINVYFELLKEREKMEPKKFLKCHFFNTFFYKKLIGGGNGYDFKSVRRWTSQRKLGYCLLECDKIFVPIHKENHWCLAVINNKDEKFQYLDSLKGIDTQVLRVLARYFVDEVKDKSGNDIDVRSWKQEYVEDLPEQKNGSDCGMFMIKYADFYSRGLGLRFTQAHMPYFRQRTANEILRLKAE